ncbi:MAG: helix-turn-helix domain-containing protein [Gordonia sp. (in: high G+C Gram-positive bacteria)]
MARQARERLLESARELFYGEGIRAVSVERILEDSQVGRASFYRHFASKDDLVVAALDHYSRRWRELLRRQVPQRDSGVLAVFDILAERFTEPDYRGCLAQAALIEFRDPGHPIHQAAIAHQADVAADLADLLDGEFDLAQRQRIGRQLLALIDAAMLTSLYDRTTRPALEARVTAAALLAR